MDNKHLNGYVDENDIDDATPTDPADIAGADDSDADKAQPHTHYPTCRFCGKQTIPDAAYESDDIADEAATMRCDCHDAANYRLEKQQKERREKNIAKLRQNVNSISDYCTAHNIKLTDKLSAMIVDAGIAVIDGLVLSAQIKLARLRVTLSAGTKSAVVIKAAYSDGTQYEV